MVLGQAPCTGPGKSTLNTDCNDAVATVFPGAPEVPDDGIDQNCLGGDAGRALAAPRRRFMLDFARRLREEHAEFSRPGI